MPIANGFIDRKNLKKEYFFIILNAHSIKN